MQEYDEELWCADKGVVANFGDPSREKTKDLFCKTDVFIITLGLSEVWYNKQTGGVFWRAIPANLFDKNKHGFRTLTHAETKDRLLDIISVIRECVGDVPIIFTLSPVRLAATFRGMSAVVANTASKAILRSAIDEVMSSNPKNVWYWPSYEMVRIHPDAYEQRNTHPDRNIIEKIMKAFLKGWTTGQ